MNTDQPAWEPQPDGLPARIQRHGARAQQRAHIAHLVTWQEDGSTRILGLDEACRPVYATAFSRL